MRESAHAGNGDAAFALSLLYLDGRGVTRNTVEGLKWLDRAIELDHPPAMLQRGGLHARDGQPAAAVRLYRMAAEKGYARAQAYLGRHFADGNGVAPDLAEAVKWYERAGGMPWASECSPKRMMPGWGSIKTRRRPPACIVLPQGRARQKTWPTSCYTGLEFLRTGQKAINGSGWRRNAEVRSR